jgi:rare lipoprotein A
LRRFRWKRRRAALALLPALAMMITAGIAGASVVPSTGTPPEATASGSPATGISLTGHRNVMAHHTVKFSGRVTPGGSRKVIVQVGGRKLRTHTQNDGSYRVRWHVSGSGTYRARAKVAETTVRSHGLTVYAFRPAAASYYGPGLYGNGVACGGTLTPGKLGVANKTLPCGSKVTLRYHGKTVTVPVIDRGPFAGNREYDLTAATKAKLGFPSTGTVLTNR